MDLTRHYIGRYKKGSWDCWTLVQDLFKEFHDVDLPDFPYITKDEEEFKKFVFANVLLEEVREPKQGLIVHYINHGVIHAGYVLNEKEFIHRPKTGTRVDCIRNNIKLYKVKGVKYE